MSDIPYMVVKGKDSEKLRKTRIWDNKIRVGIEIFLKCGKAMRLGGEMPRNYAQGDRQNDVASAMAE